MSGPKLYIHITSFSASLEDLSGRWARKTVRARYREYNFKRKVLYGHNMAVVTAIVTACKRPVSRPNARQNHSGWSMKSHH